MKIKHNSKIFYFIILVVLSFSLNLSDKQDELKQNQLKAFPNSAEAPTSKEQLGSFKFTVGPLSRSLFEEDPGKKIKVKDFLSSIKYTMYKMTRGEAEQIFVFVDQNHDDLLDQKEWDAFTSLFVFPFEACDKDGNYLLSEEEFKACFDADPRSQLIEFSKGQEEKKYSLIMETITTRKSNEVNFSDYLFLRRSLFSWKECHSAVKYISISGFKCAIRVAFPQKYHLKVELERVYKAGLKLANDPGLVELDYLSFLRILYSTYVFSIFGLPHDIPVLEKTQFIKAVREDRFPTGFEESEVEEIYNLTNTSPFQKDHPLSFESWCFFFNFHKLWNKYSVERALQLSEKELFSVLDDYYTPSDIKMSIDASKTAFTEAQYLEVSMILKRLRANERDFYFSFKEKLSNKLKSSSQSSKNTQAEVQDDKLNRKYFFTSMCGIDKQYWTKAIFYRAFQWADLYTELVTDGRFLVPAATFVEKLPTLYDTAQPPISQLHRGNFVYYKMIPGDIPIDILTFIALENHNYKFQMHSPSDKNLINETLLKMIMKDYGMQEMPDSVIDLARKGYDSLRRRLYSSSDVIKYLIIVHAAAGENARNHENLEKYQVKLNDDYSRRFKDYSRRFLSSSLV